VCLRRAQTRGVPSIDFIVAYLVVMGGKSIFFLEINPPGHVNDISSRIATDDLMKDRFGSLFNLAPLPGLHGISVMGQMLAFYCLDKATGNVHHKYVDGRHNGCCSSEHVGFEHYDGSGVSEVRGGCQRCQRKAEVTTPVSN
jgi:hypothetical protein